MLRDLHVRDLAVVADAALRFGPGLNVLTGETGAGKSLVVDSLALLAGSRASSELIRKEARGLSVSGVFEPHGEEWRAPLAEAGIETADREVVVRREISREGRNRVFVNDRPVTLRLLGELGPFLLRIHTQREELGLFSPELQRRWLDRAGGEAGEALRAEVATLWAAWRERDERWRRSQGEERLRLERIDLLRFQRGEIDAARLEAGEEVGLREERDALRHGEAIGDALGAALGLLVDDDGSASERLSLARRRLSELAEWVPAAGEWRGELEELRIRTDELGRALRERLEGVEADPGRLDSIEERLATVERLGRKYGGGSEEVLAHRRRIGEELADLEADDARRGELEAEAAAALEAYRAKALELSAARAEWGRELAERVHAELVDLAMGKARFSVSLERRRAAAGPLEVEGERVEGGPAGLDRVVFELRSNPGEDSLPLSRVASGGELSRVYLALQLGLAHEAAGDGEAAPTQVFDEVDAGLGGAEGAALGAKLKRLAGAGQILAVTHLPQVASFADRHFRVRKVYSRGRTAMRVERLDREGQREEVARMLAGREVTEITRTHADELISAAEKGS